MIILARGKEVKLSLPKAKTKKDGTIWQGDIPVLGVEDPEEKRKCVIAVKAKRFQDIPAEYFTRLGYNANGLWAGTPEEWRKTPEYRQGIEKEKAKEIERQKRVEIYLSARGWGDFSPCTWYGNITRPESEILAECHNLLANGLDIDNPNQTDEDLLLKIRAARADYEAAPARKAAREAREAADLQRKIDTGYCFHCGTWCHGDCGNYSNDPGVKFKRDMDEGTWF